MAWVDDVGWVEDAPPAPASYEEQVALAQSWGVPADQIASVVGTPESVAANNQAQAQSIQNLTGSAPSWSQDVGYTAPPPSWLNPADYTANNYAAPYTQQQITSQVDPSWIRQMAGQTYASVKGPGDLSGGEYLIDPNTGRFALDKNGNPIGVTYPKSNGFSDWVTTPLGSLALTFGAPLAAMGGVAALEGLGALGAGAAEGTTLGSLGAGGAFTPVEGASFGLVPGGAYTTGAGSLLEQLAATQAAEDAAYGASFPEGSVPAGAGLSGNVYGATGLGALAAEMGLPLSALSGLASALSPSSLASLLRGNTAKTATSGLAPALGKLAQGQSGYGMETPGIVRTNTNPFFNTPQAPIQNKEKTELSSIPDLLRQKSSWQI